MRPRGGGGGTEQQKRGEKYGGIGRIFPSLTRSPTLCQFNHALGNDQGANIAGEAHKHISRAAGALHVDGGSTFLWSHLSSLIAIGS